MSNGYGRYLEKQFGQSGSFMTALFNAIERADSKNLGRLRVGFPEEVEAYETWSQIGSEEVLKRAGEDHWIVKKVRAGKLFI